MKNFYFFRYGMRALLATAFLLLFTSSLQSQIFYERFDISWKGTKVQSPAPTSRYWSSDVVPNDYSAWHRSDYTGDGLNWNYWGGGADGVSGGALGTSYYARFHSYGIYYGDYSTLWSPIIDMASYVNQEVYLSFYYINPDGTDFVNLYFSGSGGITRQLMASVTENASVWTKYSFKIPPKYLTNQFTVDIEGVSDFGNTDIGIDEFVIDTPLSISCPTTLPTCGGVPVTLTASTMGSNPNTTYKWSPGGATSAAITVAPTVTTTYSCTATRNGYSKTSSFTVAVNPLPSFSQTSFPTGSTSCTEDYIKLTANLPSSLVPFSEDFSGAPAWTIYGSEDTIYGNFSSTNRAGGIAPEGHMYYAGSPNYYDEWYLYPNDGIPANYRPITLGGYTTATLSFKYMFNSYAGPYDRDIFIDVSTDQITWNAVWTRKITANVAANIVSGINLNKYVGTTIYLRFRYAGDSFGLNDWYIDDINLIGTMPTVSWPTITDLYVDATLQTPYVAATYPNQTTIFAVPNGAVNYTMKYVAGSCSKVTSNVLLTHLKKVFTGQFSNNWNSNGNWLPAGWPTSIPSTIDYSNRCINIPTNKIVVVNVATATGKTLTVQPGAKLSITPNQALSISESFINLASVDDVIIASDGNLKQSSDNPFPANAGEVTAKRNIKFRNNARAEYNYLISPVVGQSLKTIYPGISYVLYHSEVNNMFGNSSGAYIPGRGLAVKEATMAGVNTNNVDATFKGALANGIINFPMAYTDAAHGYNLVGNPYPSNINLQTFYTLNSGKISSTFYFWDNAANDAAGQQQQGSGYSGRAYAVYNASNNTGNEAGYLLSGSPLIGSKKPNAVAKVGQGFMVRALAAGNTLVFNNSIRTTDSTGASFFSKPADSTANRYWLRLITPTGLVNTIGVVYYEGGSASFGMDDSEMNVDASDMLYSLADDRRLQIEGRPVFEDTEKINLGSHHFAAGNYTLSLGDKEGIFAGSQSIYLKDKQTGTVTNLSEGEYTFAANAGESTGRFEIIYKPEIVLVTDSARKEELIVYRDAQDFIIKAQTKKISDIEVYDSSGRMIYKMQPHDTTAVIHSAFMPQGVYILKITTADGAVSSKKILK